MLASGGALPAFFMISTSKKCIFVHIPKTGGSSIEKVYESHFDENIKYSSGKQTYHYDYGLKYPDHPSNDSYIHACAIELRREYGDEIFDEYFKFAVKRNPWDRLSSLYFWIRRYKTDHVFSPECFMENFFPQGPKSYDDTSSRSLWSLNRYLCDKDNNLLVDYLIDFENFPIDFAYVCDRLGVHNNLGAFNMSKNNSVIIAKRDYRTLMGPEVCSIIAEVYSKEIDMFFPEMS